MQEKLFTVLMLNANMKTSRRKLSEAPRSAFQNQTQKLDMLHFALNLFSMNSRGTSMTSTHLGFTCSKIVTETPKQCVKYVQS